MNTCQHSNEVTTEEIFNGFIQPLQVKYQAYSGKWGTSKRSPAWNVGIEINLWNVYQTPLVTLIAEVKRICNTYSGSMPPQNAIRMLWHPIIEKYVAQRSGEKYFKAGITEYAQNLEQKKEAIIQQIINVYSRPCLCSTVINSLPSQVREQYASRSGSFNC